MRAITWFSVLLFFLLLGISTGVSPEDSWLFSISISLVFWSIDYLLNYMPQSYRKNLILPLLIIVAVCFAYLSGWTFGRGGTILSPQTIAVGVLCVGAWLGTLAHLIRREKP